MSYKAFVFWILVQTGVVAGSIIALLYIYDPLQLYHKPYFREATFSIDTRVQNKGIIKHYDFTHYVVGTSLLQNTLVTELTEALGGSWVNISMPASSFDTRAVILHYLFEQKRPKHIMYSLDHFSLIAPESSDTKSFDYLYDDNPYNDMQIYLNHKFLFCALRFSRADHCVGKQNLTTLGAWVISNEGWVTDGKNATDLFGGFENWVNTKNSRIFDTLDNLRAYNGQAFEIAQEQFDITQTQEYIQTYLLDFIQQHPDTRFSLIIPPCSLLYWRTTNPESLKQWQQAVAWLVGEVENLPNATIYGFDDMPSYTADIANYMDPEHYNIDMNRIFIKAIKNGEHILTPQNINAYLQNMEEHVAGYDLTPLATIVKQAAQEKRQKDTSP